MMSRHQVFTALLFTIYTLPLILTVTSDKSRDVSGYRLGQAVYEDMNQGVGLKHIQDIYDKLGTFKASVPNWEQLVQELAQKAGDKFRDINFAVTRLRNATEEFYNTSGGRTATKPCCSNLTNAKYNEAFRTQVDKRGTCVRSPGGNLSSLHLPGDEFLNAARKNLHEFPSIKWQYEGTEEGSTQLYPAFHVTCDYEPRLRPWYIETFAPEPKDIVIIMDATQSRQDAVVKEAVLKIIETTNPNDRIGVVKFGEAPITPKGSVKNSTCYESQLALATPRNKEYLMSFVQRTETRPNKEAVNFIPAFRRGFSYFDDKQATSLKRRKVLLFFTHSNPDDVLIGKIPDDVKTLNRDHGNDTEILTYTACTDVNQSTEDLLSDVSQGTKGEKVRRLNRTDNLRYELRSYYDLLSQPLHHPLFVLPYVDNWGLGLVISVCQPFYNQQQFKGVVCVDVRLADLLSDVTNIKQGVDAYTFIVDGQGRTIHHPYLSQPTETKKTNLHVHISMLERGEGVQDILASIIGGVGPGGRTVRVNTPRAQATFPGQWVDTSQVKKHYQWAKIPNTNYTLCIVSTERDIHLDLEVDQGLNPHYLHPYFIGKTSPCNHEGAQATTAQSAVTLATKVFSKDCSFLTEESEARDLTAYFSNKKLECIKDYVYNEVLLSGNADTFWKSEDCQKYNQSILWWHLVTLGGVMRIYPAANVTYDPLTQPWYVKALSEAGRIILTRVRSGKQVNIMMSSVIHEGRKQQTGGVPVAVVAAQFKYTFIMSRLLHLLPSCQGETFSCLLVDESGKVLVHTDVTDTEKLGHILDMEPVIAMDLINKEHLVTGSCVIVERLETQSRWKLSLPGLFPVDYTQGDPSYSVHPVPGTNTFIIQKDKMATTEGEPCPPCMVFGDVHECDDREDNRCRCPCSSSLVFDYCNYTFPWPTSLPPTCPLSVVPTPLTAESDSNLEGLQLCVAPVDCRRARTSSDCALLPACSWCASKQSSGLVCSQPALCDSPGTSGGVNSVAVGLCIFFLILLAVISGVVYYLWKRGYNFKKCLEQCRTSSVPSGLDNNNVSLEGGINNVAFDEDSHYHSIPPIGLRENDSVQSPIISLQSARIPAVVAEAALSHSDSWGQGSSVTPVIPVTPDTPLHRKPPPIPKPNPPSATAGRPAPSPSLPGTTHSRPVPAPRKHSQSSVSSNSLLSHASSQRSTSGQSFPQTLPPTHGQTLPPTHGQTLPPTHGQTLPPTHGQPLPPTHGHTLPPTHGQTLPPTHGQTLPPTHGQTLPPTHGHTLPPTHGHTLPLAHGQTLPLTPPDLPPPPSPRRTSTSSQPPSTPHTGHSTNPHGSCHTPTSDKPTYENRKAFEVQPTEDLDLTFALPSSLLTRHSTPVSGATYSPIETSHQPSSLGHNPLFPWPSSNMATGGSPGISPQTEPSSPQTHPPPSPQTHPPPSPQTHPPPSSQTHPPPSSQTHPPPSPQTHPPPSPQTHPPPSPRTHPSPSPQTHPPPSPQTNPPPSPQTHPPPSPQIDPLLSPQTHPSPLPQIDPLLSPSPSRALQPSDRPMYENREAFEERPTENLGLSLEPMDPVIRGPGEPLPAPAGPVSGGPGEPPPPALPSLSSQTDLRDSGLGMGSQTYVKTV